MKLVYKKAAKRGLRKMPKAHQDNMRNAIEEIAAGDTQGKDIKKLQGRDGWRYRDGGYRALYYFEEREESDPKTGKTRTIEVMVMLVLTLGPRGDVYK